MPKEAVNVGNFYYSTRDTAYNDNFRRFNEMAVDIYSVSVLKNGQIEVEFF